MTRLSLILSLFFFSYSYKVQSAQRVGQIISQYQSTQGHYIPLILDTGNRLLHIKFSSLKDKQRYSLGFKRHSGKVALITGPIKQIESDSTPYTNERYIEVDYHKLATESFSVKGIIKLNKNSRNHYTKYTIEDFTRPNPKSTQIVLSVFDDEDFLEKYQDQEVEIEYSEFFIKWRTVKFVSKIKLL